MEYDGGTGCHKLQKLSIDYNPKVSEGLVQVLDNLKMLECVEHARLVEVLKRLLTEHGSEYFDTAYPTQFAGDEL